jgi:hypothetical protein
MANGIRRRRSYPWLALVLALAIGTPVGMYFIKRAQLNSRLEAIRAAGDPLTLADLKPSGGQENDGRVLFAAAQKVILPAAAKASVLVNTDSFNELQTANIDVAAIGRIWQKSPTLLPTLDRIAGCRRWTKGLDYDHGIERYVSSLSYPGAREVSALIIARAWQLAAQGDADAAAIYLLKLFSIAAALDEEPGLMTFQVSAAVRNQGARCIAGILSWHVLRPSTHAQIENTLAPVDLNKALERALKSERVINLQMSKSNVALARETQAILDFDQNQIALARRPWSEVKVTLDADANRTGFWSGTPALNLQKPAIRKIHVAKDRGLALVRCLRVLNALAMHPEKSTGDPARLDLPADAWVDPFDGNTLHVKATRAGWLIYSVGENLVDDGGDIIGTRCKDVGLALTRPKMKRDPKSP